MQEVYLPNEFCASEMIGQAWDWTETERVNAVMIGFESEVTCASVFVPGVVADSFIH